MKSPEKEVSSRSKRAAARDRDTPLEGGNESSDEEDSGVEINTRKEKLGPSGLEIVKPKQRALPYVLVPPLRTRPIPGTRVEEPAPVETLPKAASRRKVTPEDRNHLLKVLEEIFNVPYPVKLTDILGMSPLARTLAMDLLRRRKVVASSDGALQLEKAVGEELAEINMSLGLGPEVLEADLLRLHPSTQVYVTAQAREPETEKPLEETVLEVLLQDLPIPRSYRVNGQEGVPHGALIIPDAADIFLTDNSGTAVKGLVTAAESEKIRVFYPVVNNARREESIFDEGSQVCSASEEAAQALGISWDPDLKIGLQSSNRSTAKTLGLARNVPINCGNGVIAYVQFHIVKEAAYKILLGRPFLTVMSAEASNKLDGRHTITLTDPNQGQRVVVPSYPRGEIPEQYRAELSVPFQTSRI